MSKQINLSFNRLLNDALNDQLISRKELEMFNVKGYVTNTLCTGFVNYIDLIFKNKIYLLFAEVSKDIYKLVHFKYLENEN